MDAPSDEDEAAVFDFVDGFMEDLERGVTRTLREYLERYPGHETAVAREYLALQASAPRARPDDGRRRVGPYRLLAELGRGGQGAVFLAEDTRIARRVALKLLPGGFVSDERRARLRREAEAIARLRHAGLCGIHEAEIDGETPYIAMPFVEGESMAQSFELARHGEPTALAWRPRDRAGLCAVLALFERAARALHAAHEAGVVHRDVKPGNLLVTPAGDPVVLDFGLAADERSREGITRSGEALGTPAYMSPEQLRGRFDDLDRRTDVYSLGVTLFEALTLRRPFEAGERRELERAILEQPVRDPARFNDLVAGDLRVVLETSLDKDRARRYGTALELAEDLRRVREYEPIHARPAGPLLRLRRWVRRQPVLATVLVGTFLLLATGLALSLWSISREQRALRFALGRHLAERSSKLRSEDHAAALALGIEAVELAPNYLTRQALFAALEACALERVLASPPDGRFQDLALSGDGRLLACGFADGSARVWELSGGALLYEVDGGDGAVRSLDFSADDALLALGCEGGSLILLGAGTGERLARVVGGDGPLLWVEFSPRGERLVVVPAQGPVRILGDDGSILAELATRPGEVGCARFTVDGERVLTASVAHRGLPRSASSEADLWSVADGAHLAELAGHTAAITACDVDPSGRRLATASDDGQVRLWNARDGTPLGAPLPHAGSVASVDFSPRGERLVSGTNAGSESRARVWNLEERRAVDLEGHDGNRVVDVAFSPDGTRVATSGFDMTVRIWDASSGQPERVLRALIQPLRSRWTADGSRLVTLSLGPRAHVWRARGFSDSYRLVGHDGPITSVEFSPDSRRALTSSADGTLRLWHAPAAVRADEELEPGAPLAVLRAGPAAVRGAAFLPNERVLSWSDDGSVRRWHPDAGAGADTLLQLAEPIVAVALAPLSTRAVAVSERGAAWLLDLERGQPAASLASAGARAACFAPDGSWLALVGQESKVELFDAVRGTASRTLSYPAGRLDDHAGAWDVAIDPTGAELAVACAGIRVRFLSPEDGAPTRPEIALFEPRHLAYAPGGGRLLISGRSGGGSVRVQDLEQGSFVRPEIFHAGHLSQVTFSDDGEWILSGSRDHTAYVWSARSGQPFAHFTSHEAAVTAVDFEANATGARVLLGCEDGSVSVHPMDPLPAARRRKPRELEDWEVERERRLALPLHYR